MMQATFLSTWEKEIRDLFTINRYGMKIKEIREISQDFSYMALTGKAINQGHYNEERKWHL